MEQIPPSSRMMGLINSYMVSQALHVAATLGVADLLKDGPRSADDLAMTTNTQPDALYRLLRALAAIDVLDEQANRCFALTEMGECLREDAPEPVHHRQCQQIDAKIERLRYLVARLIGQQRSTGLPS